MERKIDSNIKNQLNKIFSSYENIKTVYIFGSFGTDYYNKNQSDIDIAVLYKDKEKEGEQIFYKLSKLFKTDNVDILNLKKIPVYLQYDIIKNGLLVHEKEKKYLTNFIENVLRFYFDEKYRLDKFYKQYNKSLKDKYA